MLNIRVSFLAFLCLFLSISCFAQQGLLVEYYDGANFERYVSKGYVSNIENYWDEKPPVEGIDPHSCSIRWTGKLKPGKTATYIFSAIVDDGIRVWIDGDLIMDRWYLNDLGIFNGKKYLLANQEYDLKVEYFNALNEAEIKLMWVIEKPSDDQSWGEYFFGVDYNYEVIPSDVFYIPGEPQKEEIIEEVAVSETVKKTPTKPKPKPIEPKKEKQAPPPLIAEPVVKKEVMTIEKAEKYIPKNVQFVISKAEVLPESFEELNTFAKFMNENPEVSVTIEGHTDVVGDKKKNQELSENRAKKIAAYLREKGIKGNRIITVGYGGSKPLKIPPKGEYYPLNRRVVFKLSGIN